MPEWTLYGQTLDLEEFKKYHPGGSLAILLGEERDCTRLFEQNHCRNTINQTMLKQLAKEQGKEIDPTIKDPFQQEILQMAYDHKAYTATKPMIWFAITIACVVAITWIGWASGSWVACFLLPFMNWLLVGNVVHEAGHFSFTECQWLNETLALLSAPLDFNITFWYLQHNMSHHTHTNEAAHDIDTHHAEPMIRSHSQATWNPLNAFQSITGPLLNFTLAIISQTITYPLLLVLKDKLPTKFFGNYDAYLKYSIPKLVIQAALTLLFIVVPFLLFKWPKALAFILIPYVISAMIFMTVTQVSHIQEEAQPEKPNENWMRQMVESSLDYSQESEFWFLVSGGLNIQSLHHCLPAMGSSQLFHLYPKFRAICEKHGVKLHEVPTFWDAIKKYWSHMANLSKEPPAKPKGEGCPVVR